MKLYVYSNQNEVRFSPNKKPSLTSSGRVFSLLEEGPHEISPQNLLEIDPDIYVIAKRELHLMFEALNQPETKTT